MTIPTDSYTKNFASEAMVHQVSQFLGYEAMLLDERRFWDWFALLDDEIIYQVPLRTVREFGKDEFPPNAWRQRDNKAMMENRIKRLFTGSAWAEDPPSRTVRTVGTLLVEVSDAPDIVVVHSTVTLYRHRAQDERGDLIAARRRDRIRLTGNGPRLLARTVILADTVLTTPNLGLIL